ncbi:MAG: glycosyltransferase family 4 protein [Anaerolineales bacterium]|nr:glycosyltransferase family 4 protein [Anaerolineales bacterium]MCB9171403.1 glycosyltransferase family 4 protein [Ardenticatenales bacterium]
MKSLSIGIVSPYDFAVPGGVQEHIRYLSKHLRARGHRVDIIGPVSDLERAQSFSLSGERLVAVQRGLVPIPFGGSVARITLSPALGQEVKQLLGETRYDLLHLHEPATPALNLALFRQAECPLVATFHHFSEEHHIAYDAARTLFDDVVGQLHARIAVSTAARDFVARYFPGDYQIIPNGIECALFENANLTPFDALCDDGMFNILFLGRLEKRKGFDYLLKAFRIIKEQQPQARLFVIGSFSREDRKLYVEYSRHFRIRDVKFIGPVSLEDKVRWLKSADLFCAPSTGGESFGIVLLEAMASGTPIVASRIRGYNDVIAEGETGYLVPPKNEERLAEIILMLMQRPDERLRLRANGLAAVRRYDWAHVSEEVEAVYYRALGE